MTETLSKPVIDVRTIAPRERHSLIFSTFRALMKGASMELVNDHDPRPLYYQMQAEMPGTFTWTYLAQGPDVWHVAITREAAGDDAGQGGCCGGGCGGV